MKRKKEEGVCGKDYMIKNPGWTIRTKRGRASQGKGNLSYST